MTRRVDPRRPVLITPQGLRRIVLGGTEGERGLRAVAHASAPKTPRLQGEPRGCLLVLAHPDGGGLDEHAREAVAAAALLARADEAVVLLMPWSAPLPDAEAVAAVASGLAAAALGVDRLELLPLTADTAAPALLQAVAQRWQALAPRLVLAADRGEDALLGRRLAVRLGLACATEVVEINAQQVRVRDLGGPGRPAGDATAALADLQLLLLARQVARTELPFTGLGQALGLPRPAPQALPGLQDLGVSAGQAQQVALEEAEFILAAGQGVRDVALFHRLAQALGAAVGASRVAVDAGHFPRSQQIGATGRTVQARGYLALGISGAVQHLQGIRECRHVMAVNTDPAAPMVQRAELTLVADVQALMQALLEQLQAEAAPDARPAAPASRPALSVATPSTLPPATPLKAA
ncbi:electron transfer flavoprotein subunit alpha/FixB family protein [Ideonella livida]|uniref:Electron transfer flavoprotein subunit alpha/FixB family protein n=1 Tax=Ideonella livida TaxID=2707176 RepID=A0A7C9TKI0_9BURK|nr:electron transfer flavoprotein subunit alpha/FixB family protein [Ideonella livida]NDY91764.1 electron transfer flavoprotein subunit alpha/FixB family protein [Ideonella livida]